MIGGQCWTPIHTLEFDLLLFGPSALQRHRKPVSWSQRDKPLRLDRMPGLKVQPVALGNRSKYQYRLCHRECRADKIRCPAPNGI